MKNNILKNSKSIMYQKNKKKTKKISSIWVVIPAHNEAQTIYKVVHDVYRYAQNIIVVDDASKDKTQIILKTLPVYTIHNKQKLGYSKSLETGIKKAFENGADYAISLDADGQHRGSDLPKIIGAINKYNPDFVLGKRTHKNRLMEFFLGLYAKIRFGFSDPLCGLKAYKRDTFQKYNYLEKKFTIGTEIVFRALKEGAKFIEVEVTSQKRSDASRFAGRIKGNLLELRALYNILSI